MNALGTLFSKNATTLASLACVLLVVVMALSIADATMMFVNQPSASDLGPQQSTIPQNNDTPFQSIAQLNIFGEASREESAPSEIVDAPTTNLNLELQGVFNAQNANDSTAIIANKGKPGELYRIGERVPGNATLNAVHEDHVLIKRGARIEKLPFYDSLLSKQFAPQKSNGNRKPSRQISAELGQETASSGSSRLQQIPDRIQRRQQELAQSRQNSASRTNIREQLTNYKSRLDSEPDKVLDELGVVAVGESDASGYRIGGQVSQSLLRQSGLRQGDLIMSVNGNPVGNVSNDKSLIDQAMAAGRARVEIQRGSRRFHVTVPIPKQ